jgi:site-specific DNA recombinase
MNRRMHLPSSSPVTVAGYVRRSSHMQKDNFSIDAQKRAITEECVRRGLPAPIFYEDDERSARGEQIAKRPAFKRLLDDVESGHVQIVMVHTLDRWSRNVMVTLHSFRILSEHQVAFISLSEHIDYSTPEGRLQLTILAAFAAYFSDMLAKHTSKGKGERAAQGLYNGDIPYGYRSAGPKRPPERHPDKFPGLRLIGELRMQGKTAETIVAIVNAAGYRTGSKRFGERLFTIDTINAICRNEFYAAFAPGDDRGTIVYKGQRYRGQHQAAFTYEEWQLIRAGSRVNYHAPKRSEQARHVYEFAGLIADIHCGLLLRAQGGGGSRYHYYKDVAKKRQLACPSGGFLQVRTTLVSEQFGQLLHEMRLPLEWQEEVRQQLLSAARSAPGQEEEHERERERLRLKRARILQQHREGYIDDAELHAEMAAVELLLHRLDQPPENGVPWEEILAAGERLPGMAALWELANREERHKMILYMLQPGGLYYDLELKMIAALRPNPAFLPLLRLVEGFLEYEEATGTLVTSQWQDRNRRDSNPRSSA